MIKHPVALLLFFILALSLAECIDREPLLTSNRTFKCKVEGCPPNTPMHWEE